MEMWNLKKDGKRGNPLPHPFICKIHKLLNMEPYPLIRCIKNSDKKRNRSIFLFQLKHLSKVMKEKNDPLNTLGMQWLRKCAFSLATEHWSMSLQGMNLWPPSTQLCFMQNLLPPLNVKVKSKGLQRWFQSNLFKDGMFHNCECVGVYY